MTFSNRTAPDDTAIKREPLNENIEVSKPGRYYPDDYSTLIKINQQNQGLDGEIPKTLASIVEYYDDYKRTTWAHEEQTRIEQQRIDNHYAHERYKEELHYDMLNEDYDRQQQLQSDLNEAAEAAKAKDGKVKEAVLSVLEEYQYPEGLSPAAQRQWQSSFNRISSSALDSAQKTDFKNAYFQNRNNINHLIQVATNSIAEGTKGAGQVFEETLPELLKYRDHMLPGEFEEYVQLLYSRAVRMEGELYESQFRKGDITGVEATNRLRNLLHNYRNLEFEATDTEGEKHKFKCSLNNETQQYLLNVFNDTKAGGNGPSDANLDFKIEEWHNLMGWDEFKEKGYSQKISGYTPEQFRLQIQNFMNTIYGSNGSADKKYNLTKQIAREAGMLEAQLIMANLIPIYGQNAVRGLQKGYADLVKDLNGGNVDFTNYSMKIPLGSENKPLVSPLSSSYIQTFGNASAANKEYFTAVAEGLKKLADFSGGSSLSTVIAQVDGDLISASEALTNNLTGAQLLDRKNGKSSIADLTDAVKLVNDYVYAWNKYPQYDAVLSDKVIQGLIQQINQPNLSPEEQVMMSRAMGHLFTSGGVKADLLPSVVSYYKRTKDKKALSIMTGLALYDPDNKAAAELTQALSNPDFNFSENLTEAKNNTLLKAIDLNTFSKQLNISSDSLMMFSDLFDKVKAVSITKSNPSTYVRETMSALMDPLFVKESIIKGSGLQGRPFIYSPQMKVYKNTGDYQLLGRTMKAASKSLEAQLNNIGVPGKVTILSDDEKGQFYYAVNGKRYESLIPGRTGYIGSVINTNEAVKNPGLVGAFNASKCIFDLAAQDAKFRRPFAEQKAVNNPEKYYAGQNWNAPKLKDIYKTDDKLRAAFASAAYRMGEPDALNRALKNNGEKIPAGAVQNMKPTDKAMFKVLMHLPVSNTGDYYEGTKQKQQILNTVFNEGTLTGPAANITDFTDEDYDELMMERSEVSSDEMSPEAYKEMIDYFVQSSSSAQKINTADISIPITHAAVGDENYVDAYTNAIQAGFEVDDGYIPGATRDTYSPKREYEGATGFASSILPQQPVSKITVGLDGTLTVPPKKGQKKEYTKNDVMDLVDHYADTFGIPRRLAHALTIQESGNRTNAVSHKGATGVCQLMPATAQNLGVDMNDVPQNIWGGMKYLAAQFQSFGSWDLALAAYNAGPGAVNKYKGVPPYKETQNYVKNILKESGFGMHGTYPVDFKLAGGNIKFLDSDTGLLSPSKINDFVYLLKNNPGYGEKVDVVYTNRPELTQNKPEYEAFAKYRAEKVSGNKPMFVYNPNVEGFSVMLKTTGIKPGFSTNAGPALADSISKSQTQFLPENDRDSIEALLNTFADRYKNPAETSDGFITNQFGLANLTPQEYADYGVPADVSGNPELQARVLNLEFQRAIDILGSDKKAIYALAGGNVIDDKGNVKSWKEVKADRDAYMKQWFIKPSENARERDIANAFVESYQKYYGRLRGEL